MKTNWWFLLQCCLHCLLLLLLPLCTINSCVCCLSLESDIGGCGSGEYWFLLVFATMSVILWTYFFIYTHHVVGSANVLLGRRRYGGGKMWTRTMIPPPIGGRNNAARRSLRSPVIYHLRMTTITLFTSSSCGGCLRRGEDRGEKRGRYSKLVLLQGSNLLSTIFKETVQGGDKVIMPGGLKSCRLITTDRVLLPQHKRESRRRRTWQSRWNKECLPSHGLSIGVGGGQGRGRKL